MANKSITERFFLLPQGNMSVEDLIRTRMMETAERYANHEWTGRNPENVKHNEDIETPDRHSIGNDGFGHSEDQRLWPTWRGWAAGSNCGVPYFWNGVAALDPNLGDFLQDPVEWTFDQVLSHNRPAGDRSTVQYTGYYYNTGGVDCSGFVSQVWRLGVKKNSWQLASDPYSRPIEFSRLKAGDLLYMNSAASPLGIGHVLLFKEFVNADGSPSPIPTKWFTVYEASSYDWRVSLRQWELVRLDASSNVATIKRARDYPCNGAPQPSTDSNEYPFTPHTHITFLDVVLVIDHSASMASENKMQDAKEAARMFVDLMEPGGRIGIVPFYGEVDPTLVFPLTEMDLGGVVKAHAKQAIAMLETVPPGTFTSIGRGLEVGRDELNARGSPDHLRIMVLLSDGIENKSPYALDVLPSVIEKKIVVFTVGLGSDAAHGLLEEIANRTGGIYRFAPSGAQLLAIFGAIAGRVYGESGVKTASGTVSPGGMAEQTVLIDSTIGSATFSLFWRGSELDLTLVQPDGSIIDPSAAESNPKVSFTSGGTYQFYKIYNPQAGEWTMRIFGKSTPADGEAYSIAVSAMEAMEASIEFDQAEYFAGEPVQIRGRIEDTFVDFAEPSYILGATIKVTVEDPGLNHYSLELYDDGLHGDGEANDGVYANTFADTSLIGNYNFKVQVSGTNNRSGQPFTREYTFSRVLKDPALQLVLDDFNRKNGKIGRSWSGRKSGYRIVDQQVNVRGGGPIYWKPGVLAADQQAFFTLAHVDPSGLEQGLLLKVQDKENHRGSWRRGAIAVYYSARESKVGIKTYIPGQEWKILATFDATLRDGDQLGGRAEADGKVRAFVNGGEIGSVDAGNFFVGKGGRIGMWFNDADGAVLDDFGGGGAINVSVIQGTDDAGPESSACYYRTDDENIYFGHCMDGSPIVSGFRFQNVPLPARAAIVEAHLEFTVDGPYANEMALRFFGERSANAVTFSDTDRPSDRPMTAAWVPWAIPGTNEWIDNQKRRTPAVTTIVQELVNLPGWESGNAMVIIVQADPAIPGDTHRRVFAWERERSAVARLTIIYTIESFARGDDEGDDDDNDDDDDDNHDNDR